MSKGGTILELLKYFISAVIGGGLGYLYYKKVGCASGTCPLTSRPYITTIYGAVVGLLLAAAL